MQKALIKAMRNHRVPEDEKNAMMMARNDQCISEFRIQDLFGIAMIFVVTGIAITYGLSAQEDVSDDMTDGTSAKTAAEQSINGTAKLAEKMPMIATIVVAAIVIGVLVTYFVVRGQ